VTESSGDISSTGRRKQQHAILRSILKIMLLAFHRTSLEAQKARATAHHHIVDFCVWQLPFAAMKP